MYATTKTSKNGKFHPKIVVIDRGYVSQEEYDTEEEAFGWAEALLSELLFNLTREIKLEGYVEE